MPESSFSCRALGQLKKKKKTKAQVFPSDNMGVRPGTLCVTLRENKHFFQGSVLQCLPNLAILGQGGGGHYQERWGQLLGHH